MSDAVLIRPFEPDEWALYRDLRLRALTDSPNAFAKTHAEEKDRTPDEWSRRLMESATSPSWLCLIATLGDKAIGLSFAHCVADTENVAHLYSMWVDPVVRGLGIGRRLVEAVLDWSRERKARRVVLQVTEGNQAAVSLYQRAGFRPTDELTPLRAGSTLFARMMVFEL